MTTMKKSVYAGILDSLVTCPIDNIKTNTQSQLKMNPSLRNLYRGFFPYTFQIIGKNSVRFHTYSFSQQILNTYSSLHPYLISLSSGFLSGMIDSLILTTPLERIKVWNQTSNSKRFTSSTMDIIRKYGITGMWTGGVATTLKSSTGMMMRFFVFEQLHSSFQWNSFISGGIAGVLSIFVNHPLDVIKTQIQQQKSSIKTRNLFQSFQFIYRKIGFSIFTIGLVYRIPRIFISQGITFMIFY